MESTSEQANGCAFVIVDLAERCRSVTRLEALNLAMKQIEQSFGKGALMRLGESKHHQEVEVVSSGSLALDIALGVGGLPKGRIVEIYGPESSGKTTVWVCLQLIDRHACGLG